ncbi:MAG: ATP-binding protein [Armatimonadetes bacterium]|nr:ATP-binding protein [Armatimonadota bacterium]
MTDYLPREMTGRLARAMAVLPVVVLSGLRQAGKSTLLRHESSLAATHDYRTLDEFATLAAAQADPDSLLAGPVVIDEVQRCPELLMAIKRAVDSERRNGHYVLSGSANLALLGHVAETLAGRAGYLTLHPMARRERRGETEQEPFLTRFLRDPALPGDVLPPLGDDEVLAGGLPPACLAPPDGRAEWFRAYVQTYVERDLRQISQITDLVAFRLLAQLAALRTGQMLNASALGREARLTATTTARYLDLLETSFLVRRLPPHLRNRGSRLVKTPKLYFTDSGLAAHLAGMDNLSPGTDDALRGALYETYVGQNLAALLECHRPDARLSYWQEQGRHEVDFVIEDGARTLAIEVKAASHFGPGDLAGLRAFIDRAPQVNAGILAYNGETSVSLGDRLWAISLAQLLA